MGDNYRMMLEDKGSREQSRMTVRPYKPTGYKGFALRATGAHDPIHTTRLDSFLELSMFVQSTRFRIVVNHTLLNNRLFLVQTLKMVTVFALVTCLLIRLLCQSIYYCVCRSVT